LQVSILSEEEDDFGVFHSGRRYKRLNIGVEKGDLCSEYERRVPYATKEYPTQCEGTLTEIGQALLKEFKKMKFES
jgi:hypothetical protein